MFCSEIKKTYCIFAKFDFVLSLVIKHTHSLTYAIAIPLYKPLSTTLKGWLGPQEGGGEAGNTSESISRVVARVTRVAREL